MAAVLVVLVATPDSLSRAELVKVLSLREPSGRECGTGETPTPEELEQKALLSRWTSVRDAPHSPELNAMLMELSSKRGLRTAAFTALSMQKSDEAVVDFFLRNETDPRSLGFLVGLNQEVRDRVLARFDTGDFAFDRAVLRTLEKRFAEADIEDSLLARFEAVFSRAPDAHALEAVQEDERRRSADPSGQTWRGLPLLKHELVNVLTRYAPEKYLPVVVRSKRVDHAQAVAPQVFEENPDALIAVLAWAPENARGSLERTLIKALSNESLADALAKEWLSRPKPGLLRAPASALALGDQLQRRGDTKRARALYAAGKQAARAAIAKTRDADERGAFEILLAQQLDD